MGSPQRDRQKCAENFLLFFNWKILKKIEKGLVSTWFKKPGFSILHYNHRIKQNKKSFCTHFCRHCKHYKENTCSKFQKKMIISTWQIGNKVIGKNNNINSKDSNINMNLSQTYWAGNVQLNSTSQSWYRIWKTHHSSTMLKLDETHYDRYVPWRIVCC